MLRVDLVLRVVNGVLVAVIVHSICIPNSCIFHIAKTGLSRCCLHKWSDSAHPTMNLVFTDFGRVAFQLFQFGNFSQQRTTLSIARQDCRLAVHPKRKVTVVEPASTELLRQMSPSLPGIQSPVVLNPTWP